MKTAVGTEYPIEALRECLWQLLFQRLSPPKPTIAWAPHEHYFLNRIRGRKIYRYCIHCGVRRE